MPPVKFSFAVSLVISFLFLLITFWIFYSYSWSAEAAKDALSTVGSYYGAAATLGAAVIAAYLYVDWRIFLFLKLAIRQEVHKANDQTRQTNSNPD